MARTPSIYVVKFASGGTSQTFTTKAAAGRFAKRLGGGQVVKMRNPRIKLPSKWTAARVRTNAKGEVQIAINPSKVNKSGKFAKCVKSVEARGGAYDARAVCASAGRKKYGLKKFAAMATAGRRRNRNTSSNKRPNRGRGRTRRRTR